jgi:outer membrane protein assembly factor BamB
VRKKLVAGALAVVLVAAGLAGAYVLRKQEAAEDVRGSSTVEFVASQDAEPPTPVAPTTTAEQSEQQTPGVMWPTYGYDNARHGVSPWDHRPPFRRLWEFGARSLVEFPPAVGYGRLYFTNNDGVLFAVNAQSGKRAWRYRSGRCAAASPAVDDHTVYQAFLYRGKCTRRARQPDGEIVAFAAGFGKVRWKRRIGASETSPLVADGVVYVGDWNGKVWALDAKTGDTRWTFTTTGEVKAALTSSGDRIYAASYDHHLYALSARNGKLLWRAKVQPRLGSLGTFYSTPAAAYGRVYIGATDGKVYSYGATSGLLRWSHQTGDYVYASPTIWRQRVLIGSYDSRFYALDAATGDVIWRFKANGPISGSATVVGNRVYFSTLKKRTYALDARNGKLLWSFPDGQYSPVVTDAERLYLIGQGRIYGMESRRP